MPRRAVGRWQDLVAAVAAATDVNEMAVLGEAVATPDGGTRFELLTIKNERGELTARAVGGEIELAARIDSSRAAAIDEARRLVRDIALRLSQLHTSEWAPLPRGW